MEKVDWGALEVEMAVAEQSRPWAQVGVVVEVMAAAKASVKVVAEV